MVEAESRGLPAHTEGGLLSTSFQTSHVSAFLHMVAIFAKGLEGASGPGTNYCCCLWLPLPTQAAQPLVLTSTTVTSSSHGNRAQGQGPLTHPEYWASPCQARSHTAAAQY